MDLLKEELQGFDFLSAQSKIELWLCYRDLKPVSAFPMLTEYESSIVDQEKLYQWIKEAGLQGKKDTDSRLYIVSKEEKMLDELLPIVFSNTKEDIVTKCELYGYPKETALAIYRNFSTEKSFLPKGVGVKKDNNFGIYWWPYVRYVVREGHEYEDSLVAKRWSEVIKEDFPEVDKEFELQLAKII